MHVRILWVGALLWSCTGSDPAKTDDDRTPPATDGSTPIGDDDDDTTAPEPLAFAGIGELSWDGADGLVARWDAATGPAVEHYEVEVTDAEGVVVQTAQSTALEHAITGLADGEHTVRVTARSGAEADDGGRSLTMLVGTNRLVLRSFVPLEGLADVWGEGDIVVAAGRNSDASFYVFDVSDPTAPVLLHTELDGGYVKDVKLGDGFLYTQSECGCSIDTPEWEAYDKLGARIWDVSDPAAPVQVGSIGDPVSSVHNLAYGDGVLYLSDNLTDGVSAWDVSDPAAPFELWAWLPPAGQVHDQAWVDGKLYVAWWEGFSVWDVTDPALPLLVLHHADSTPNIHNAWPTTDEQHLLTTSEIGGGRMSVYDISDPASVWRVTDVEGEPGGIVHNVHVRGDFAYAAWYRDGVVVFDISDPTHPIEVGRYDTQEHPIPVDTSDTAAPAPPRPYSGAWGVWPYGEVIAVTDMQNGLFLFDHYDSDTARAE
jgi:hypothetical protein